MSWTANLTLTVSGATPAEDGTQTYSIVAEGPVTGTDEDTSLTHAILTLVSTDVPHLAPGAQIQVTGSC